ncbi:MAG: SPOR domain-containing protein [Desulfobacterales bacterium]|nr:SPOR domain-containing protein [Desulfobacterales bacterium]
MKFKSIVTSFFILLACSGQLAAAEYVQLPGVVHVHSTVSSGLYSLEELVLLSKELGLEVLVMTDQDLVKLEYGIFPFRNLIKKKVERNSVTKLGPEKYLSMISQVNQRQKDVVVVPGVQSSPFYYWTGSILGENLTAHNYHKELLLIGMLSAEDYRDLPLQNRGFSTRYIKTLLLQSIFLLLSFFLGIYLVFQRGYLKVAGIIISLFSMVLLINHHPFQSSRFDAYHGDQGIAPYQDLIDYVNERGGLTFWAHPESNYSKSGAKLGPIKLMTMPYVDSLLEARDYTGFSAIYDDTSIAADPGKKWDLLLNEYCSGRRSHPVWGIAGANFQGEADGVKLDTFQTIFITKSKSVLHIIDALAKGRVYTKLKEKGRGLTLGKFSVEDAGTGATVMMGAELNITSYPVISAKIISDDHVPQDVKVLLVKGGAVLHQFEGKTPLAFVFDDRTPWVSKSYYRLEVQGGSAGRLLSNPIFVDRKIPLSVMTEHTRILKESEMDKAAAMETTAVAPMGSVRKQERYPINQAVNIQKPPPVSPPVEKTISGEKAEIDSDKGHSALPSDAESQKQVTAALSEKQGQIFNLPDSELMITVKPVPYSVQVASLPSFELAQKTLESFKQNNLPVYLVKVNLGDKGTWWRMYVGYFASQKAAMAAREIHNLPESIVQKTPYANLIGVYASLKEISAIRQRLEAMDYSTYVIKKTAHSYHLYVGAFITLKGAKELQRELEISGIATEVVRR